MSAADVAVIIVTYRSAQLTIDALRSVEAERTASGLRVRAIVVDNDSADLPVIARATEQNDWSSWLTLVNAPRNGGFAYGNNLGIAHAYAAGIPDYIYLLNPDTQIRPGGIAALVRFLTDRPDVGIAGSTFENLDGSDWPIAFRFPTIFSELDAGLQWGVVSRLLKRWVVARVMTTTPEPVDWICGASMMIRPAVLASTGGLDENYFLYFEETDFCRRARLAGHSTWYVPESRVMHIMGQSTSVTDTRQGLQRLPPYWFESRRRYYVLAFGLWRAAAIDLVALMANSIGHLKRILQGKRRAGVPHFIRDLIRHSVLWPRNRSIHMLAANEQRREPDSPTA
jgi:N-acetylglucosaminyl-diphospho-decaprenol L-rhamnosyltransferase